MSSIRTYWHKTIALVIIGAFVYVQATALTCVVNHLSEAEEISNHPASGAEKHHHGTGKHDENEKDCCSDFTQSFLSAFAKSSASNADFFCKVITLDFVSPHSQVSLNTSPYATVGIVIVPPLPPPKIPDIRVFIHSFQI